MHNHPGSLHGDCGDCDKAFDVAEAALRQLPDCPFDDCGRDCDLGAPDCEDCYLALDRYNTWRDTQFQRLADAFTAAGT